MGLGHIRVFSRKVRAEYPGAVFHGLNQGDGCEPVFKKEVSCQPSPKRWAGVP